ncbi:Hpt domain-containing protein [Thermodesulfobacteriota bacterium]
MSDENNVQDLDNQIMSRMLKDFLNEAREHLDQLNLNLIQLEETPEEETLIDEIFRTVHTLKGSASFAGLKQITEISRKMEEVFGNVRKGNFNISPSIINIMFEALDILNDLIDSSATTGASDIDLSQILEKLDRIPGDTVAEHREPSDEQEIDFQDPHELLNVYKEGYDQLVALKHLVYSSVHLSDPESLAVLFSNQIDERMSPENNAFWLVKDGKTVEEIARNGKLVKKDDRRSLEIESSEILKRAVIEQSVIWPSSFPEMRTVFPKFENPILFPIKAKPEALGFLVLDPEESADVELYQFVGQFAAMIINISKLHQTVEEQKEELDELTEILFKQNSQLASLYHAGLDLMKVVDPVEICRIVTEAVVDDLEASKAVTFLIDESSQELVGAFESGGLKGIDSLRLPIEKEKPIKKAVESGRIITYVDYPEKLHIGSNVLENWIVLSLKGRGGAQGVLAAEVADLDIGDPISILANYSGILLDNLRLQKKVGNTDTKT